MTPTPRLAALAAALLLAAGCSSDNEPGLHPADPTTAESTPSPDPTTSPAPRPTGGTGSATSEPAAEPLVIGGGSGATMRNDCGDESPGYVSLYKTADVTRELRLGDVTVAGGGRLVGRVFIAPTRSRGPDRGALVIADRPGFGAIIDDGPEWRDRVPVPGQTVLPGAYRIFAQVELRPGGSIDGLVFAYTDTDAGATGSAQLDVPARMASRCRD